MQDPHEHIQADAKNIFEEWSKDDSLKAGDLFVVGCSTSEVIGEHIGSAGSEDVASIVFEQLRVFREKTGVELIFQCCEHLNRALVMERRTLAGMNPPRDEVSVIPVPDAGGSMATYAYTHFDDAVVVETVQADAGIDIGDTLIGMQLKQVAVPIRFSQKSIGNAHVTAARTRPKLIGGKRAQHE